MTNEAGFLVRFVTTITIKTATSCSSQSEAHAIPSAVSVEDTMLPITLSGALRRWNGIPFWHGVGYSMSDIPG